MTGTSAAMTRATGEVLLLALAGLTGACGAEADGTEPDVDDGPVASASDAIVGGHIDKKRKYVGYVNLPDGACTGTLISPKKVLTAAHCVYTDRHKLNPANQTYFYITDKVSEGVVSYAVERIVPYPGFKNTTDTESRDQALLVLRTPVTGVAPARVGRIPDGSDGECRFQTVGFGLENADAVHGDKERRKWTNLCVREGETWKDDKVIMVDADPSDGGGVPCNGDSGGPLLLGNRPTVIGVLSNGLSADSCAKNDDINYYPMADRYFARCGNIPSKTRRKACVDRLRQEL